MKVLVICGHPDRQSYCHALAHAYIEGAQKATREVETIHLSEIHYNPNLQYGYRQRTELEVDLQRAQALIQWADHLVIVYPTWWGTMPAVLKGFFDRVLLPGFAYQYRENSMLWDKLLKGKTARVITTMDTPSWYNRWVNRRAGSYIMKHNILQFCGVKPVKLTELHSVKIRNEKKLAQWLEKVRQLGAKLA